MFYYLVVEIFISTLISDIFGGPVKATEYNNYVNMEGFYWSIELPDLTKYGLTSELKPERKSEASIMAMCISPWTILKELNVYVYVALAFEFKWF